MAIASNFPAIRPSLNLDFANAKALDPRITFGRASAATYYDGKTVAKAEENLLVWSQQFGTGWATSGNSAVTTDSLAAPDYTVTANTITASATTGSHAVTQATSTSGTGKVFTASTYIKAGSAQYGYLSISSSPIGAYWAAAVLDLSSGLITQISNGTGLSSVTSSVTAVGSGWYLLSLTATYGSIANTVNVGVGVSDVPNPAFANYAIYSWAAAGTESVYVWGAQLELRSQVTAYTPTAAQPITNYIPVLQTAPPNVPRIDHDPVTGECKGLLIEEQRTNLLLYSELFAAATWVKTFASLVQNATISPAGTLTATKLFGTSGGAYNIRHPATFTVDVAYTATVYAKKEKHSWLRVNLYIGSTSSNWFNLETGTIGTLAPGIQASMTPVGNGWFRCSVTRTGTSLAGGADGLFISSSTADNLINTAADGYSGIYIWGAQIEAGSFPTSYIKTEAAQVTRAADPNLTAALGQPGAGTIYVDATVRSGNTLATSGATTFAATASTRQKTAVAYDAASTRKSINGAAVTSSAGTQGGSNISIAPGATGWIKKLSIYPQKFFDAQLQALTA